MKARYFLPLFCLSVWSVATPAMAASVSYDGSCPSGNVVTIRISKLTPKGTIAGYLKAASDHAKWYHDHGYADDQLAVAPILVPDAAGKKAVQSPDTVMNLHFRAHDVPAGKQDAAWKAYVAEYRANSDIVSELTACMPK